MLRHLFSSAAGPRRSGRMVLPFLAAAGLLASGSPVPAQYGTPAPGYGQQPPPNLAGVPVYEDSASYPQPESQPVAPPPGSGWGVEGGYNPTPAEVMAPDRGPVNAQIAGMMEYTAPDQVLSVRIPSGSAMTVRAGAIQSDGCRGFTYNYNGLDGRSLTVSGRRCRTPAGDWVGAQPDRVLSGAAAARAPAQTAPAATLAPGTMPQPVPRTAMPAGRPADAGPATAAAAAPSATLAPPAAAKAPAAAPVTAGAAAAPRVVLASPSAPLPPEEDARTATAEAAAGDSAVVGLLTRLGYLADARSPDRETVAAAIAEFEKDEGIASPLTTDALRTRLTAAAGRTSGLPRCAAPSATPGSRYGVCVGGN